VLVVRNIIMYSVVSAILLVASFGIYNTLSTIVLEKTRDIAILKSMGFHARDVRLIFLFEGVIIGVIGSLFGLALGAAFMHGLSLVQIKPPGVSEKVFLPIWWGAQQFALATAFAMTSCILAAWLPARRAGRVHPVEILRGAA
jgi:lipoprotein-releasing system permease protein